MHALISVLHLSYDNEKKINIHASISGSARRPDTQRFLADTLPKLPVHS